MACVHSLANLLEQGWVLLFNYLGDIFQTFLDEHVELLLGVYSERDVVFDSLDIRLFKVEVEQLYASELRVLLERENCSFGDVIESELSSNFAFYNLV